MNQFDAIAINDANQAGVSHKAIDPLLMRVEQAKQACPVRHTWKQLQPIVPQPAVKGSIATSFQGKEQSQSDNFTRNSMKLNEKPEHGAS
jgi:hypothetical protein